MKRIFQQIPVLFPGLIPLPELSKLISHKIQLLARVHIHISVKCLCLREFDLIVTKHFLNDRCFSMYHFIMGKRMQEQITVKIHHGKAQLMIIIWTVHRCSLEKPQGIIHKAHVPLIIKSKTIIFCRCGYLRKIGRVLCHQNRRWMKLMKPCIHIS